MPRPIIGKDTGKGDLRCKCNGQVMVDGEGWLNQPIGFGFHNDGKFHVDAKRIKGWFGVCLDCQKEVFVPKPRAKAKLVSKILKIPKG